MTVKRIFNINKDKSFYELFDVIIDTRIDIYFKENYNSNVEAFTTSIIKTDVKEVI